MRLARIAAASAAVALGGCKTVPVREPDQGQIVDAGPSGAAARILVVERGAHGSRLQLVDEGGRARGALAVPEGESTVIDLQPAWSPDGRWIVFASSRERGGVIDRWSLWIVGADGGAPARRLTEGDSVDGWPAWAPDGKAIVFASTREGARFDLWRMEIADGKGGALTRLTKSEDVDEIEPAWSPHGGRIAFSVRAGDEAKIASIAADGSDMRVFSAGPRDGAPAWSPDGKRIVFAARAEGRSDLDLFVVEAAGGERHVLVDDPAGDEAGAHFSSDGRFVFATAVVRDGEHKAVIATVVFMDMNEKYARYRALGGGLAAARLGVALAPEALDAAELAKAPRYHDVLEHGSGEDKSPD